MVECPFVSWQRGREAERERKRERKKSKNREWSINGIANELLVTAIAAALQHAIDYDRSAG